MSKYWIEIVLWVYYIDASKGQIVLVLGTSWRQLYNRLDINSMCNHQYWWKCSSVPRKKSRYNFSVPFHKLIFKHWNLPPPLFLIKIKNKGGGGSPNFFMSNSAYVCILDNILFKCCYSWMDIFATFLLFFYIIATDQLLFSLLFQWTCMIVNDRYFFICILNSTLLCQSYNFINH